MKNYIGEMVNLKGDGYLNPGWAGHNRPLSAIKSIAVHHDAVVRPRSYDSVVRFRDEAKAHYERLGPGLQYHFKIDNAGGIFWIRPFELWLHAVGSAANYETINICLDGYFHAPHNQKPTREQYEALSQLLIWLGTEQPAIPASLAEVFAHSVYSATACCGDLLRPYVNAVTDVATARNIPDVPYDWPELQPQPPAPAPAPAPKPAPAPAPAPTPPPVPTVAEWTKNFKPLAKTMWTEGTATVIDVADGNKVLSVLPDNKDVEIGGTTTLGGTHFYVSQYWVSRLVFNKLIPQAQLKDSPDVIPLPEPPKTPTYDHADYTATKDKVNFIYAFLQRIFPTLFK